MKKAFTVWVSRGRIGTYPTREQAEAIRKEIIEQIANLVRIDEWMPGEHYDYVTFNSDDGLKYNKSEER